MRKGGTERKGFIQGIEKVYHIRTTRHHDSAESRSATLGPLGGSNYSCPTCAASLPRVSSSSVEPVRRTGKPGAEDRKTTNPTRAISSGTATEAVTRPESGRVDISAVRPSVYPFRGKAAATVRVASSGLSLAHQAAASASAFQFQPRRCLSHTSSDVTSSPAAAVGPV